MGKKELKTMLRTQTESGLNKPEMASLKRKHKKTKRKKTKRKKTKRKKTKRKRR